MAKSESRLLSGRIKTKSGNTLDSRRTTFLSLDNAEPNFGNPDSDRYVLASLANGERLFLKLNKGFLVSADSVSGDESTFEIDPSGLVNANGTTLAEVLDQFDSAISLALLSGSITDDNFNGSGTVSDPLTLDSDLRIFGITGDSATFTNITSGNVNVNGTITTDELILGDNEKIQLGAGNDLQIYHDGSNSFITENGTGNLRLGANDLLLRSNDTYIQSEDGLNNAARFNSTTGVSLFRAGDLKLATTSTGVDVTGTVTADGLTVDTDTLHVDATNNRVGIGTSTPSYPLDVTGASTTARFYSGAGTDTRVVIQADENESAYIEFYEGGDRWATGPMIASVAGLGNRYAVATRYNGSVHEAGIVMDGSLNVGIGTTNPSTALDVSGTITTNEVLTDSATITNITSSGTVDFSGATVTDGGTVTTVDIDGGTIDGATIATSNITVGFGKTLDVSAGTLTLANDQISGDKIDGGTIDTVTVNNLTSNSVDINGGFIDGTAIGHTTPDSGTFTNLTATTVDINGGNIDGTTIATSDITVGSGKTLDVSAGTLTLANDQISGDKVEGGTIDTVTVNNLTSGNVNVDGGFIDGTAIGHITPDSGTFTNLARTSPSGVTAATYGSVTEIPVFTVDSSGFIDSIGEVSISTTLNTSGETGTGSVSLLDSSLNIAAGEGINTVASGNTITVSGELADNSNKGVASFDAGDFSVSSGAVSIKTAGVGNNQLENDTVTIGSTGIALGETSTTLSGLTQVNTTNLSVTDSATINHATVTNLSVTDSATINHATITTLNVGGGNFTVQEASGNTQVVGTLDVEAQTTLASVNVEDLTDNRIVIVGASGELEDDPNFTFNGTQFDIGGGNFTVQQSSGNTQIVGTLDVDQQTTLASVNVQDLTNDRLVVAGTSGELEDDANLTYNGSTLTVANNTASTNSANGALVVTGGVGIGGALNVNGNTEIAGDLTVTGTTTTIEVQTLAINDPLIHLADSNESGDEVDIGFVGHYYDVALGGRQHTGLFRDATDDKYYLFAQYQDSALDSSPRANVIDRSDPSFVLADFNAATIFADTFSGTVSADSITTTNLTATGTVNFAGATVSDGGTVTTVDINGGTIDGATIATSNITVGSGKTLDVSAGTLTLANDQISGDKVEGGTINGVTINNLTSGNVNINSGFIDGTAIGHTTPDSGTFTNLTSDNLTVDTNTLYVDAVNNRVGIGTTSPNFKLDVMGSSRIAGDIHMFGQVRNYSGNFTLRNAASDADMFFNVNDGGVDTTVMTIDGATANVGIGTTTPAYDLDVDGSIGLTADATNKYYITNDGSFKIALAGIGSLVTVNSSGNVGIGTSSPSSLLDIEASTVSAEISLNHTGSGGRDYRIGSTGTGYGSAGNLVVYDATAGSERMRIDASGKVGIGTSSPADLLHVKSSTVAVGDYQIVAEGTTGGYGAGISFQSQLTGGSLAEMARITADGEAPWNTTANTQDAGLRFYTSLDGSLAERMRIDRSGNVGIGTTSPSSKLEVVAASSLDTALGVTIRNTNSTSDPQFELGVGYPGYYDNSAIIKHNNILTSYINTSGQMNFMTTVQIAANKSIQSLSSGNAQINLYDINNNTAIGYANNLVFNSSGTEIARFTNTGNLGIGTTSPATALDVAGTVTADGLTVDGDITFSDSDDLIMPDNSVIKLGDTSDLQIYHDGSNSYVKDIGTGVLNVQGSSQVNIGGADGTIGVQFVEGANVTLRHNNVPILSTASTGINVTGTITADGIDLGDNEKAQFGASNDLQIYHDGFNSYIHDNGTGNLNLRATDHRIEDGSGNAYLIGTVGTVYLYKDGVQKLSTTSTGIDVTGEVTADSGTFTNLARTSPSGVTAGSYGSVTEIPVVTVDASGFIDSIGEVAISTTLNTAAETGTGSVNLLDSSLEIAAGEGINTTASGRTITVAGEDASTSNKGVASFDAGDFSVSSGAVSIKTAGVGNDQLEFDSVTVTAGSGLTGGGSIALGNSTELKLDSAAVKGLFSGGANINYNNSTGEISASASGVVAGVYGAYNRMPIITVDSYGQVDSIGLTAIEVGLADTVDSINFDSNTGVFRLTTDITQHFTVITLDPYTTDDLSEGDSNQYYTKTKVDSDIDQAFNENPSFGGSGAPFSVTSDTLVTNLNADKLDGISSESFLRSDAADQKTSGDLRFNDNIKLTFGASDDLRIYHDQQNSYINETGTGNLKLLTNGQSIILEDSTNDKVSGQFTPSASVELYYAGNKKFETSATGVTVTGEVTADSATFTNITRTGTTVVAGTYGSQTTIPVITVDGSGFVDSIGTEAINTALSISAETGTGSVNLLDSSLEIAAGSGIDTVASNNTITVEIDSADLAAYFSKVINHDQTSGFVANEHIDHSTVSITAGNGLTGGGNITSPITLNVVGGDGITANANEIEVTVDNSTIELSANDGSGAVRVKDLGITNAKLAGSIENAKLSNSSVTVGSTEIALGATSTTLAGLTQVDVDNIRIDGNTISSTAGSYMYIDPHPVDSVGTLVILGNLSVEGTTTTIKSTTVSINDKNIVLADNATSNAEANGAGITVNGSNATITYDGGTNRWDFNKPIEVSTVHGALSGNASTASALSSAVTVALTGDVTGSATFTNAGDTASIAATIAANSVALGTDTTGNYVASLTAGNLIDLQNNTGEGATPTIDVDLSELTDMTDAAVGTDELVILDAGSQKRKAINEITLGLFNTANQIALGTDTTGNYVQQGATSGNGISGSVNSEGGTFTVTSNATNANTASTIVFRDASGNFSAGTITAALSGNASTASSASALSSAVTVELTGDVTGSATFTNAGDTASIATTIVANSVELGTGTTGNYVATVSGTTNEIEVTGSGSEGAGITIGLPDDVTVSNNLTVNNDIVQENHRFASSTITRASTAQVDLDTFSATTYSGAEVNIMAISSGERHITKLLVVHDGTTAYATEYGSVYTNTPLATYDVDISGGNVRIRVTPASATSTVFNTLVTLIEN